MNVPNALTTLRMALVPVFIVFFYIGRGDGGALFSALALAVFAVASLTDALDGHIARKHNLITNFGKLMDPLADKVLTTAAFVCFVDAKLMPAWMLVVILAREFAITGLRGVAAAEGEVIAAGFSGKLKTVFQMAAILLILLGCIFGAGAADSCGAFVIGGNIALWAAGALTVWSGAEYLWKGRKFLKAK